LNGTFGNERRKPFEVIRPKSVRPHLSEKLLVEGQGEGDVDDGEVVDGQAAQHADQEKVEGLFKAKRVEPEKGVSNKFGPAMGFTF
jgi:hypothetical protein